MLPPRTDGMGMALAFPPPFFSVQSTARALCTIDVRVGIFTQYIPGYVLRLETYYGLHTTKVNARPPHVA